MLSKKDETILTIRFPTVTRVSKARPVIRSQIPQALLRDNPMDEEHLKRQVEDFKRLERLQLHRFDTEMREFVHHQYVKQRAIQQNHNFVYRQYGGTLHNPPPEPLDPAENPTDSASSQSTEVQPSLVGISTLVKHCPQVIPEVVRDAQIEKIREEQKIQRKKMELEKKTSGKFSYAGRRIKDAGNSNNEKTTQKLRTRSVGRYPNADSDSDSDSDSADMTNHRRSKTGPKKLNKKPMKKKQ